VAFEICRPAQWKSGETFALLQEFNEKCVKFHMKTQFEKHSHNSKCPHFGKTEHSILHLAVINITRILYTYIRINHFNLFMSIFLYVDRSHQYSINICHYWKVLLYQSDYKTQVI
jgi:hypothetical protein